MGDEYEQRQFWEHPRCRCDMPTVTFTIGSIGSVTAKPYWEIFGYESEKEMKDNTILYTMMPDGTISRATQEPSFSQELNTILQERGIEPAKD